MDTQELPNQTQKRLLALQQRMRDIMRTALEVRGLDPQKYAVDIEEGYIRPIQSEHDPEEETA
jgi:hypothetical protein